MKETKCSESRKVRKPLMEKKRRARINDSLNELKRILLESTPVIKSIGPEDKNRKNNKSNSTIRPAKLEKADILELTVKHLQALHRLQSPDNFSESTNTLNALMDDRDPSNLVFIVKKSSVIIKSESDFIQNQTSSLSKSAQMHELEEEADFFWRPW